MQIPREDQISNPCEYISKLSSRYLQLSDWGFRESYQSKRVGRIIYDSPWCRLKIVWSNWDILTGNGLSIYYGRLHAPSEDTTLTWNGEICHCWHPLTGIGAVLDFLDGLTPEESARSEDFPFLIKQIQNSPLWHELAGKRRDPELLIRIHAAIWEHYGLRLFELFDLRRPELWEGYRQFMKEVYDLKGRSPFIQPPLDKVC